ncbi:MAG TPA: hypothetical protein VM261_27950 [Kofleriaceae bacterium]|nr:hypothetical protein [Kofleriaceae bacterium]
MAKAKPKAKARTKAKTFPRVTLFVPGEPGSVRAWNTALRGGKLAIERGKLAGKGVKARVDVEWVANDGHFGKAFAFGTVIPEDVAAIDAAPGALVLHWHVDLRDGRKEILSVVERLEDAGALAVRVEQSKLGWEIAQWIELLSSANGADHHRAVVTFLGEEEALQSCGMHAFSLPDVYATIDGDAGALQELATTLNVYQLTEDPAILSGHTFRPDVETPRRVVDRWPDTQYPPDHACHNPYGVWRLGPPGGTARDVDDVVPVFVPSLAAVLTALEKKHGKPLTKKQVESARDGGACIAMTVPDLQKLERSRGYADLDPEFAWEQWKLVRKSRAA